MLFLSKQCFNDSRELKNTRKTSIIKSSGKQHLMQTIPTPKRPESQTPVHTQVMGAMGAMCVYIKLARFK